MLDKGLAPVVRAPHLQSEDDLVPSLFCCVKLSTRGGFSVDKYLPPGCGRVLVPVSVYRLFLPNEDGLIFPVHGYTSPPPT